jgi:hypothetical protein
VPTAVGAAAVLLARATLTGGSTLRDVGEAAGYVLLVVGVTWAAEGRLVRESIGYLRKARRVPEPS